MNESARQQPITARRSRQLEHLESRRCPAGLSFTAEIIAPSRFGEVAAVADLDGDEDLDLVMVSSTAIATIGNGGRRGFSFPKNVRGLTPTQVPTKVEVGDIDGDGDADLLFHGPALYWLQSDGRGNFHGAELLRSGSTRDAVLSDTDGDGDLDVAAIVPAAAYDQAIVHWFENIARHNPGTYGGEVVVDESVTAGGESSRLLAADLNGDDRSDLIVGGLGPKLPAGELHWHASQDVVHQPFSDARNIGVPGELNGSPPADIVTDLDGDGDLDLLGMDLSSGRLWWMPNQNSQGDFGPRQLLSTVVAREVRSMTAADIDNDGNVDLVVDAVFDQGETTARALAWLPNLGGPDNFAPAQMLDEGIALSLVADVDGDGDMDILGRTEQHSVLLRSDLDSPTSDISKADFDGDGDVTVADFRILQASFAADESSPSAGDLNDDGRVDFADFLLFRKIWNR